MISIQVLRGFAALLVVLVHSTLKAQSAGLGERVFEIGHSGVDLFFIISGFIMMMIGARENNKGYPSLLYNYYSSPLYLPIQSFVNKWK